MEEQKEFKKFRKETRTASKKRIEEFVNKVNTKMIENQKALEQKRKLKQEREEIELQKIMRRSISKGKISRSREREHAKKLYAYENKKWENRNNKVKQKELQEEIKIQSYFKPKVSESSKRLAKKKRVKEEGGNIKLDSHKGADLNQDSTIDF